MAVMTASTGLLFVLLILMRLFRILLLPIRVNTEQRLLHCHDVPLLGCAYHTSSCYQVHCLKKKQPEGARGTPTGGRKRLPRIDRAKQNTKHALYLTLTIDSTKPAVVGCSQFSAEHSLLFILLVK